MPGPEKVIIDADQATKALQHASKFLLIGRELQQYPEPLLAKAFEMMHQSNPALVEWTLYALGRIYKEGR